MNKSSKRNALLALLFTHLNNDGFKTLMAKIYLR